MGYATLLPASPDWGRDSFCSPPFPTGAGILFGFFFAMLAFLLPAFPDWGRDFGASALATLYEEPRDESREVDEPLSNSFVKGWCFICQANGGCKRDGSLGSWSC